MNEEEKKAIYKIQRLVEYFEDWNTEYTVVPEDKKYFDSLLNLIEKQQKEIDLLKDQKEYVINEYGRTIEKKDKIIDLIAEELIDGIYKFKTKKQVIEYFTKKAEGK